MEPTKLIGLGAIAALVAIIAIAMAIHSGDEQVPNPTIVKNRESATEIKAALAASASTTVDVDEAEHVSVESAAYKQEPAQQLDPDAVFAVDIKRAVAAGQVEGPNNAIVTIVEAWDFGWPYCFEASSVLDELVKQYGGKVRVVYMNMVVHPELVQIAHQYGCAAAKQGKFVAFKHAFWDQAYRAYEAPTGNESSLGEENLKTLATGLGLDVAKLSADANSDACKQRVADDMAELGKFYVHGTPAFFVNGKYTRGSIPKAKFQTIIDDRIRIAEKSGVPGATYYDTEVMGKGVHGFRAKATRP